MAATRNDKLEKTLSGINTDSRFTTWLWFYINNVLQPSTLGDFDSFGMRDRMADAIINNPWLKPRIQTDRQGFLVPEESLNWIKNDKRQCHWITRKIAERNGFQYITGMKNLNYRDLAIATIDIWNIPITDKSLIVTAVASEWGTQEKADKIFEWFYGPDESSKLELAREIAIKLHPLLTTYQSPWQETADMIVALDTLFPSIADKKLFIDSLKKRWSQNKYRANATEKKQCNFILTKKSIDRLQKLADKHELKRAQVLEILLQMEEEKGFYISERLKVLKNI
jgi:hypothetical protein